MRLLTILAALALLLLAPVLYLGPGAAAREKRRETLAGLERQRADLQENLDAAGRPPSTKALARMRKDLADRRADREAVLARLLAFRAKAAPTDVELRRAGEAGRLTAPILEPLLAAMPEGAAGDLRRRALHTVFLSLAAATAEPPANVTALKVAREAAPLAPETGLVALRVELDAIGPPTAVAFLVENLLATADDAPLTDLVRLEIVPDPESGATAGFLPVRLTLALDVIVGETP